MTTARGPASLADSLGRFEDVVTPVEAKKDATTARFVTALLLAAGPLSAAQAQEAAEPAGELPPLTVETTAKKKKQAAAKKKAAPVYAAPQASPAPQAPSDFAAESATAPGANPYANPDAPYQVQRSGSSRLTEPLADTPRTITAIPKEAMEDKGARDLRELARSVPGVSVTAGEGGAALHQFNVRGFNARNDVFIDGIRDPGNISRDVFTVEQLEIYKGPSGSISGRATPGGAFNFISKKPDLNDSFYEVATTIGTDDLFRTVIDANQVITPNFAARANIMYNDSGVAGRDFVENERWGGLLSATARVTEDVTVTLDYYRYRLDGIPDNGVPVSRFQGLPFTEFGVDRKNWYGDLRNDFITDESDVGTATIQAKLTDNVTLTSITRYGQNLNDYVSTTPRPTAEPDLNNPNVMINVQTAQRRQETELFAHQSNLAFEFNTGPFKHAMIAGIEYSRETMDRASYARTNSTKSLFNPNPWQGNPVTGPTPLLTAEIETIGLYLGDTVHITDQWIVHGGVRFDDFKRNQIGVAATNTANVEADLFSWNAGIVYKPVPNVSIYAAYATTESPIGNELDSVSSEYNGLNAANAHLPPEETKGVEVGTKWELAGGRLLATAAIFETIKDNARTDSIAVAGPCQNREACLGEFRVRGIELGLAGNITDEWSVFGGAVFLDTEVLDSHVPTEIGRRLANVPHTQFSLLSKYKVTDKFTLGGQATYQSELFAGHYAALLQPVESGGALVPGQTPTFYRTTSYWRFDAFAEYQFDDNWSVEVSGLNLTDELYYDAVYRAHNTWAYVAPGRAGYLTVKWKY